ncbi:replication factor A protein [Senna tora]|uniref:Replication factor A protein n=1 Tax=Senna tora TaxID=362788 RepID=A0A834WCN9_9FABA|nr:replication factor A protein [Senna tora]
MDRRRGKQRLEVGDNLLDPPPSVNELLHLPQHFDWITFIRMTLGLSFIQEICPGRFDWKTKVRILSLWKVHGFSNPSEISYVDMIVIDEKEKKNQMYIVE